MLLQEVAAQPAMVQAAREDHEFKGPGRRAAETDGLQCVSKDYGMHQGLPQRNS